MTITIEIDDPLASILRTTAASRYLTASQLAKQLLADALGENFEFESKNRRRIELIRKSHRQGLSVEEHNEIQELQDAADQRLEQRDLQLLDHLNRFRADVAKMSLRETPSS